MKVTRFMILKRSSTITLKSPPQFPLGTRAFGELNLIDPWVNFFHLSIMFIITLILIYNFNAALILN